MAEDEDARWARTSAQQAKIDAREAAKVRKKTGGRKRGSLNKRTLEKLAQAEHEISAHARGKKLAVDHMDEMVEFFRGLVAALVPWNPDGSRKEGKDDKVWFRAVECFQGFLNMRAPYQTPRLSAVAIMPGPSPGAQRTTVNVTILNERGERVYSDSAHGEDDEGGELLELEAREGEEEAA